MKITKTTNLSKYAEVLSAMVQSVDQFGLGSTCSNGAEAWVITDDDSPVAAVLCEAAIDANSETGALINFSFFVPRVQISQERAIESQMNPDKFDLAELGVVLDAVERAAVEMKNEILIQVWGGE